jgi:hypothetical protein
LVDFYFLGTTSLSKKPLCICSLEELAHCNCLDDPQHHSYNHWSRETSCGTESK